MPRNVYIERNAINADWLKLLPRIRLAQGGQKQGRFVTIDEQPVFVGGPGQGGGGANPAGTAPTDKHEDMMQAVQKLNVLNDDLEADRYQHTAKWERSKVKHEIAEDLAERSGLPYDEVNNRLDAWSDTSADSNAQSLALQVAAAQLMDQEPSEYVKDSISRFGVGADSFATVQDRKFVKAMYQATQERLQAKGFKPGDTVRLQRGVKLNRIATKDWLPGDVRSISTNSLTSWTADVAQFGSEIATRFARWPGAGQTGFVLEMEVPIEAIISTARTGIGCLTEGEFVVLGGEHDAKVVRKNES